MGNKCKALTKISENRIRSKILHFQVVVLSPIFTLFGCCLIVQALPDILSKKGDGGLNPGNPYLQKNLRNSQVSARF